MDLSRLNESDNIIIVIRIIISVKSNKPNWIYIIPIKIITIRSIIVINLFEIISFQIIKRERQNKINQNI